ncbi:hypothetical protein BMS3Abin06_02542 [bacterium BMS3Abin06]|nr:hypothetical protein BMS3Abin06_02542 [bacterium BMS3Abin06]
MLYHKNDKGYTLVEMLIAIVIGFVLISAATATYISQNRSYVAQESVSEINTQSKIAHDLIADAIRSAGYGVPASMNQDPINGFTTIVTPVEGGTGAPDAITIVGGFRRIGQLWPAGGGAVTCPAVVPLDATAIRINYSGNVAVNAASDRSLLSIDGVQFVQVSACTITNGSCVASADITLDRSLIQDFPLLDTDSDTQCDVGRPVYLVEDITFCVDANSTLRRIRRNADITNCAGIAGSDDDAIAENIEDLQFAYAVDADNDGEIDDLNNNNMLDGGDFINGSAVADPADIRAIRVNVLARADKADVNYAGLGNPPGLIENRSHAATNDSFRRRWWQTLVTMRN